MPTFNSASTARLSINRLEGTPFVCSVSYNGSLYFTFSGASSTGATLRIPGVYVVNFTNLTLTDPLSIRVSTSELNDFVIDNSILLSDPLILIVGLTEESNESITVSYGSDSELIEAGSNEIIYGCAEFQLAQGFVIQDFIEDLRDPVIIGNLDNCNFYNEIDFGNPSRPVVCSESDFVPSVFFVVNKLTYELLYSRVECCCPLVEPGEITPPGFVCTCPDWGRATSYNMTLFNASVRLENWVTSNAGAKADCKHIMAAKRIMGIDQPIYSDPPYSAPPAPPTPD